MVSDTDYFDFCAFSSFVEVNAALEPPEMSDWFYWQSKDAVVMISAYDNPS